MQNSSRLKDYQLMNQSYKFYWNATFYNIKRLPTNSTILQVPNIYKDIVVNMDASKKGLGVVLMQDGGVRSYAS